LDEVTGLGRSLDLDQVFHSPLSKPLVESMSGEATDPEIDLSVRMTDALEASLGAVVGVRRQSQGDLRGVSMTEARLWWPTPVCRGSVPLRASMTATEKIWRLVSTAPFSVWCGVGVATVEGRWRRPGYTSTELLFKGRSVRGSNDDPMGPIG
jgi:hypothetical protein